MALIHDYTVLQRLANRDIWNMPDHYQTEIKAIYG